MLIVFGANHGIGSALIRLWTKSRFSHVGLVRDGIVIDATPWSGVRAKPLVEWSRRYPHAAIGRVTVDVDAAWFFASSQVGKPYDYSGLFGFVSGRDWQEPDSWFCSELVATALFAGGCRCADEAASRVTPQDLLESEYIRIEENK